MVKGCVDKMIYCPDIGVVHAAIQKTGSLSMRRWLICHYGGERVMGKNGNQRYHRWELTKPLQKIRDQLFVFTVVRHPIKRMESLWNYRATKRGENESFEDMVRHYHGLGYSQTNICDQWVKPDRILNLEKLVIQVPQLPFYDSSKPMPAHRRKTDYVKPKLTNAQERLVRELFAEDFERYGYD
jgi:hypothetical protein